ncbi:MAG: GntR family transcriptional regulator [Peptoniphilus sp.]|nr:GntR family transcriptional regulator [Peptoniphilus sp.]MDD7363465.1 GntR family transcriptional regulator [Bacillota bacterium]MDY6044831.1 GntR family transcriptional regulator [Peptoniphilus sp.]
MAMKTNSNALYEALLKQIIDLTLYPGMRLSENAVSKMYNVSRSVVRGAFARLVECNFLEVYPQRGTYVSRVNLNYIRKALFIRAAVEKEILRSFMIDSTSKDDILEKMAQNLKEQRKFVGEKQYVDKFRVLDEQFHNYILIGGGSEDILHLLDRHLLHIARWRNIYVRSGVYLAILVDQHESIVDAIQRNDLEGALEATSVHINTVHGLEINDPEFQDYFE